MAVHASIDLATIADFRRRHHVRKLSVFGSALRDDFGPDSDIDLLVEFEPRHVPRLLRMPGMEIELAALLGRPVDLRTAEDLSHYFRSRLVETGQPV